MRYLGFGSNFAEAVNEAVEKVAKARPKQETDLEILVRVNPKNAPKIVTVDLIEVAQGV